jgi:hypothetical protein
MVIVSETIWPETVPEMVRPGERACRVGGASIVDDGQTNRIPAGTSFGWFFLRVVVKLGAMQVADLADNHGITFQADHMIQPGWFKVYLNGRQLAHIRSVPELLAAIPVKAHVMPKFAELAGETEFMVQAADHWQPQPPIAARKAYKEMFTVTGATAEEIFADPMVVSVEKKPQIRLQ